MICRDICNFESYVNQMVGEKVRKDVLRSQYSELCNITNLNGSRSWTSPDQTFCQSKYLQVKPFKEVAEHYIDDIIENIGRSGLLGNWTSVFLSGIWEKPSMIKTPNMIETTTISTDAWIAPGLFDRRKKRESAPCHNYSSPPLWEDLMKENRNPKHNQCWHVTKNVSIVYSFSLQRLNILRKLTTVIANLI